MNSKLLKGQHFITGVKSLTYQGIRCAGSSHGGPQHVHSLHGDEVHGHDHHDEHYKFDSSQSMSTQFKIPFQKDLDYQLPKKGIINEKFHQWVAGRWPVDRDDILDNTKVNKYSAYYWFGNYSFLQNKLVLNLVRMMFDNARSHQASHHDGLGGVKTNENSLFLYKSLQSDSLLRSRFTDYFMLFSFCGLVSGYSPLLILPLVYSSLSLPRKVAILHYFTFHAELLPHTEQVVFHKVTFFGKIKRIFVDIKNLEKIEADIVPSKLLWQMNIFDPELVFRDMETKEIFVFTRSGIWNEEALKHKLLY